MSFRDVACFHPTRKILLMIGVLTIVIFGHPGTGRAEVCNLQVATDGNPNYADMGSMLYSITSRWEQPKDKCWALWYWNHIARRQTLPMHVHGRELTDPIRQFNDYGYTMCSTVAGVNCSIWGAMGMPVKFWDISLHTVPEVFYDGRWHMYDSSLTALYTLCDGKTIAGVEDIGADGACAASGGKTEPGHIARYHCLNATGPNGFLAGCDCMRSLAEESKCFNPKGLKYRYYLNNWDLGHRTILNLRDHETYTRYYHRLDADSPHATAQGEKRAGYQADPAYFVPNESSGADPESANPRYHIRGNGQRNWTPPLTTEGLAESAYAASAVRAIAPAGVEPAQAGQPGEIVFKIEGANVITSLIIRAAVNRQTADDRASIAISTNNGLAWKEIWQAEKTGQLPVELQLIEPVNGSYEDLVKVSLLGKAAAAHAQLSSITFQTITQLNSKTLPTLRLGKNTVCVGSGEPSESTVLWPNLTNPDYKSYVVEEKNVRQPEQQPGYLAALCAEKGSEDAYVVFRMDAPRDIQRVTYGGRFYNRGPNAHTELLHSFDGGKTWISSYKLVDTTSPWDVIHYEKVAGIPAGTKSVLLKYLWGAAEAGPAVCGPYAVRMEANYAPAVAATKPLEVTFTWNERQGDYTSIQRSHRQLVEKLPFTYAINVGGADHPIMESVRIQFRGEGNSQYGYSDGKDTADATKFTDRWVTYGKNLALGKPYTCSVPCRDGWGANDGGGKILTDGIVGSPYVGGSAYQYGMLWHKGDTPQVTVDLGQAERCAAFRIQTGGYPFQDALKGEVQDRIEVFTSADGKQYASQGYFDCRLRWKDIAVNDVWPDEETLKGPNYLLVAKEPVQARYVRFAITPQRILSVSEVQVLDSITYEPFDLKLALPDGRDRSDITACNPRHFPSQARNVGKGGGKSRKHQD
jgi:hypothetical protein